MAIWFSTKKLEEVYRGDEVLNGELYGLKTPHLLFGTVVVAQ